MPMQTLFSTLFFFRSSSLTNLSYFDIVSALYLALSIQPAKQSQCISIKFTTTLISAVQFVYSLMSSKWGLSRLIAKSGLLYSNRCESRVTQNG
ncbi:hypothetical protein BD560DRAFT_381524, partial [Blakeslea trispora]